MGFPAFRSLFVAVSMSCVAGAVARAAQDKLPVPNAAAQAAAEKTIQESIKGDSKSKAGREAAAAKLWAEVDQEQSHPDIYYVLLRDVQTIAAQAGNLRLALDAMQRQADAFDMPQTDNRASRLAVLTDVLHSGQKVTGFTSLELAESIVDVGEQSLAAGDLANSAKAAQTAQSLTGVKDPLLAARAKALVKHLDSAQRQRTAANTAEEKLRASPEDGPSNLVVGRYRCFVLNDWKGGLPLLALASDPAVAAVAGKEMNVSEGVSPDADAIRQLGDDWWAIGHKKGDAAFAEAALSRAAYWYMKLLPSLSGLQKTQLQERLAEARHGVLDLPLTLRNYEIDNVNKAFFLDDTNTLDELQFVQTANEVRIGGAKKRDAQEINGVLIAHNGKAVLIPTTLVQPPATRGNADDQRAALRRRHLVSPPAAPEKCAASIDADGNRHREGLLVAMDAHRGQRIARARRCR